MKFKRDRSVCNRCIRGSSSYYHLSTVNEYLRLMNISGSGLDPFVTWDVNEGLKNGEKQKFICGRCKYVLEHLSIAKQDILCD